MYIHVYATPNNLGGFLLILCAKSSLCKRVCHSLITVEQTDGLSWKFAWTSCEWRSPNICSFNFLLSIARIWWKCKILLRWGRCYFH